ncbi:MAG TPA: HD domain-containing phosphohydrolase [Solirubrobacteraceae bacterium]|nr:HD domain-containing phosphohydrolase [Solirubrobacteraceae bacterium]
MLKHDATHLDSHIELIHAAPVSTGASTKVRLAELVAILSLGTDLGMAQPMEHALRQSLIALRLAECLGLDESERVVVYYVGLLAWVGCHVDAYEQAKWFGDDTVFKGDARQVDMGKSLSAAGFVLGHLGASRPLSQRARTGIAFLGDGRRAVRDMVENHWLATNELAAGLALGDEVRDSLYQTFERWDGKGAPAEAKGAQIRVAARLVNLADVVEVFHRAGGLEAAIAVARERSGTQFDPELVALFCAQAPAVFAELDDVTSWDAVIAAEPALAVVLSDEQLDASLEAIADFVDIKSPWTIGHSRGVAALAAAAARGHGLSDDDVVMVRRAGLVHDLGRLGVSNTIWDKRGLLTAPERERVRLHPYLTERMLASSAGLSTLGAIAVQHHERLDGSGYPRGLTGDAMTLLGKVLATADAYHAMTEPRPHRPALPASQAATELRAGVGRSLFEAGTVDAVLRAAGHAVKRRRALPAGLTPREVEVLRLLVRGLSYKEIAQELVISRKTAGSHVEHIYAKLGVSNRARASLFAMKHGLMASE